MTPLAPARPPLRRSALCAIACVTACAIPADSGRYASPEADLRIVETVPAHDQMVFEREVRVDLCLNKVLDPATFSPDLLRLRSGSVFYDSDVELELLNWRDPGSETSAQRPWCAGSVLRIAPRSPLPVGIRYRVLLQDGLKSWQGGRFATDQSGWVHPTPSDTEGIDEPDFDPDSLDPYFVVEFEVASDAAESPEDPPPETPLHLTELFEPGHVFDPLAGGCTCHADPVYPVVDLLDLRTPERAYQDLVLDGRPSSIDSRRVVAGAAYASYVVHKLGRLNPDASGVGQPLERIVGSSMPPLERISAAHLAELSRWIDEGAEL